MGTARIAENVSAASCSKSRVPTIRGKVSTRWFSRKHRKDIPSSLSMHTLGFALFNAPQKSNGHCASS